MASLKMVLAHEWVLKNKARINNGKDLNPSSPPMEERREVCIRKRSHRYKKNAKTPTLGPASRWSPLVSAHRVTGWDEGIKNLHKTLLLNIHPQVI